MENTEEVSALRKKAMLQTMISPESDELRALEICHNLVHFMDDCKISYKIAMRVSELFMLCTCTEFKEEKGKIVMKLARYGQDEDKPTKH